MSLTLKEKMELQKAEQEKALEHPPIAPKPDKTPKPTKTIPQKKPPSSQRTEDTESDDFDFNEMFEINDEDVFFDWSYLTKNSSFQRGFQEFLIHTFPFLKGINARLSKDKLEQKFKKRSEKINEAIITQEVVKHDTALLSEIRSNALFLSQKRQNNPTELAKLNKPK